MHGGNEKYTRNFSRKTRREAITRDLSVDRRIILKYILEKQGVRLHASDLVLGTVAGSFENCTETLGSI
jgi:hypothetical protein